MKLLLQVFSFNFVLLFYLVKFKATQESYLRISIIRKMSSKNMEYGLMGQFFYYLLSLVL